jgi:hypothetical protein
MFRFTIRDVLWLTVVVAILVAYWANAYRASVSARDAEKRAINAAKQAEAMAHQ